MHVVEVNEYLELAAQIPRLAELVLGVVDRGRTHSNPKGIKGVSENNGPNRSNWAVWIARLRTARRVARAVGWIWRRVEDLSDPDSLTSQLVQLVQSALGLG